MQNRIKFDFVRTRFVWMTISLIVIGAGIASFAIRGLNYGIDFTGGRVLWFEAGKKITTRDVERVIAPFDIKHNPVQILSGGREFMVKTEEFADPDRAKQFGEKVRSLLIAFNVELHDIDPQNFKLYGLEDKIKRTKMEEILSGAGFATGSVTLTDTKEIAPDNEGEPVRYEMTFRFNGIDSEEQQKKLATALYDGLGGYRQFMKEDKVDPVFGIELKRNAAWALIIATIGILIYVTIRFEFWNAIAAIIALIHDCLVTVGFYSILQLEVNSAFVAIILTVFGYSINDTIIIFDRIRENVRKHKKSSLTDIINGSLWETMARSLNTMLTTQLTIIAILVLGGQSIKDFALGMCIGIFSGGYSSILIAAPLLFIFKTFDRGREESVAPQAAGRARKPQTSGAPAKQQPSYQKKERKREEPAAKKTASAGTGAADKSGADSTAAGDASPKKKKKGGKSGKQRRR